MRIIEHCSFGIIRSVGLVSCNASRSVAFCTDKKTDIQGYVRHYAFGIWSTQHTTAQSEKERDRETIMPRLSRRFQRLIKRDKCMQRREFLLWNALYFVLLILNVPVFLTIKWQAINAFISVFYTRGHSKQQRYVKPITFWIVFICAHIPSCFSMQWREPFKIPYHEYAFGQKRCALIVCWTSWSTTRDIESTIYGTTIQQPVVAFCTKKE